MGSDQKTVGEPSPVMAHLSRIEGLIMSFIDKKKIKYRIDEDFITQKELVEKLPFADATFAKWRKNNMLGYYQVGHVIYYSKKEVDDFLLKHYNKALND